MIDAIWILPAVAVAVAVTVAYRLGLEVGRDIGRREQQARDRHPASRVRKIRSNAVYYGNSDGTIINFKK